MQRSIPARAGEAAPPCYSPLRLWVHPRPCGGSSDEDEMTEELDGPSPPVRGKL